MSFATSLVEFEVQRAGLAPSVTNSEMWLVEDILLADRAMVIGGPDKCFKTSIALDMAISLATGTPFLQEFPVARLCRVMYAAQRHDVPDVIAMAARIAAARGWTLEQSQLNWVWGLPRLSHEAELQALQRALQRSRAEV